MDDPVYEDIDESGESLNKKNISLDARKPDTDFERALINTHPTRKYFDTKAQHKRAKKIEERLINGTDAAKIFRVFCWEKIKWGKENNIPLSRILTAMENQAALITFTQLRGDEILKKKSAQEVKDELKNQGVKDISELYNDD